MLWPSHYSLSPAAGEFSSQVPWTRWTDILTGQMDGFSHLLAQMDCARPSTGTSRQNHAVHSTLCMAASNPSLGVKLEGQDNDAEV